MSRHGVSSSQIQYLRSTTERTAVLDFTDIGEVAVDLSCQLVHCGRESRSLKR
jgi:hypothetical protein